MIAARDPRDGVPVVGSDDELPRLRAEGVEAALLGIGGVRNNGPRAKLFAAARDLGFTLPPVVHARAIVAGSARLGDGTVVLAGAIVAPGAVLGQNVIVNTGAIVEHDCKVGRAAHLGPLSGIAGDVSVGPGALLGIGAKVIPGVTIGANCTVGAGGVVISDLPPEVVAVGVPARILPPK